MKSLLNQFMSSFLVLTFTSLAFAQSQSDSLSVLEIKGKILSLAKAYEGLPDTNGSKTRNLADLINQLTAKVPDRTMAEKARTAVGAWRQVWGPYFYNDAVKAIQAIDPKYIYQIISVNGTYTNVGVYHLLGLQVVGLLKGQYRVETNQLAVEFIENGIVLQSIPQGYTLGDLPALHEAGKLCVVDFPSVFPPVGIRGGLREVYSDETLRITYGTQQGKAGESLYVLERVQALNY